MTVTTEPAITTKSAKSANPHRIPALITGWAVPFVFIAALWGAGHDPANAGWSAGAFLVMVGIYLTNKVRQFNWNRRARRAGTAR